MARLDIIDSNAQAVDDGTYILYQFGGITYFKIRKSDGQLFLSAGVSTDATL